VIPSNSGRSSNQLIPSTIFGLGNGRSQFGRAFIFQFHFGSFQDGARFQQLAKSQDNEDFIGPRRTVRRDEQTYLKRVGVQVNGIDVWSQIDAPLMGPGALDPATGIIQELGNPCG
jgi:hypothetical protein